MRGASAVVFCSYWLVQLEKTQGLSNLPDSAFLLADFFQALPPNFLIYDQEISPFQHGSSSSASSFSGWAGVNPHAISLSLCSGGINTLGALPAFQVAISPGFMSHLTHLHCAWVRHTDFTTSTGSRNGIYTFLKAPDSSHKYKLQTGGNSLLIGPHLFLPSSKPSAHAVPDSAASTGDFATCDLTLKF